MNKFEEWLFNFTEKYTHTFLICLVIIIFIGYFGIYSLLGNDVVSKTKGMIELPIGTSVLSIIAGIYFIFYILKDNKK